MGLSMEEFESYMSGFGYRTFDISLSKPLRLTEITSITDVVFLPPQYKM